MNQDKIEPGDVVAVHFLCGESQYGCRVLYTPQATGDSWHIRTSNGALVYLQNYEFMTLEQKGGDHVD